MLRTNAEASPSATFHRKNWSLLRTVATGCLVVLTGCTAAQHRRAADKEVYKIVRQAEQQIFGRTNEFTIDTAYSSRKPAEILPTELIEDRRQTNRRTLTIEQALDLAVNNSRRYQAEKERLYLTALNLTGDRYEFSPQFFAGSTATINNRAKSIENTHIASDLGVSQFLKTGGRLSVALANDILRYYTGQPRREVISLISVNLTQPLLRGFGANDPTVEALKQSERNVIYGIREYAYFQDQFALEIVNDYFNLLEQKDVIRNRYTNYLGRVRSTQRLEARKDRDKSSDVDQARQAELSSRNNYVNALASYRNSLDQFKIKLGLPIGEKIFLDDQALAEVKAAGLVPAPLDVDQAYRLAVEKHLQILNAIDQFEDTKRKIRVAKDAFKPGLDLFGDASLESTRPTDYARFNAQKVRADAGISLDLPIDRLPQRNNYRRALVTFEAEIRNLTLTLDSLKDSIERGVRTLEQRRQNYEIQKSALALADRRVAGGLLRMQAGVAEVRDLVEAQDAQINAQNAVTSALLDYQESRLLLMLDIGALQTESDQFWLKDHLAGFLPEAKAAEAQPATVDQAVLPPDQYFNN
jgi:outer membrane protein TolC